MYVTNLSFWRFGLALLVVAIPAAILERTDERWAWRYVALILLMLAVFHYDGLRAFNRDLQQMLRR